MRIRRENRAERNLCGPFVSGTVPHPRSRILKGALKARHQEPFERALGRAVRELGGDYTEYVAIITAVREYGRAHKLDLRAAARILADQP